MSIATELENFNTLLTDAYNKCEEKGADIPEQKNLQNLTPCIDSISGGDGGGGFDLRFMGFPVTVETNSAIKKGGTWEGVLNDEYVQGNLGSQTVSTSGISVLSKDLSVGCGSSYSISTSTTSITIWLFNEETSSYDSINVDVSGVVSDLESYLQNYTISEDGSLIMFHRYNTTPMFVEVDKETRTAQAYVCKYTYAVHGNSQLLFGGKYVAVPVTAVKDENDVEIMKAGTDFYVYDRGIHDLRYLNRVEGTQISVDTGKPAIQVESNTWLHVYSSTLSKLSLSGSTFSLHTASTGSSYPYLSADGQYLTCSKSYDTKTWQLYKINIQDLSKELVTEHTYTSARYWFLDGMFLIESTGNTTSGTCIIYDISGGAYENWVQLTTGSALQPYKTRFNWSRHKWLDAGGTKIYGYPQGGGAEYLISAVDSTTIKSGKVYGIASSPMNLGDIGEAQLLFLS